MFNYLLFVKIKRYNYKINYLNNNQIKIFNANKEIYIKRNNYLFDKDDLKLKMLIEFYCQVI